MIVTIFITFFIYSTQSNDDNDLVPYEKKNTEKLNYTLN